MPIIDGSTQALVGKLGVFVGMDYVGKVEFTFNKTIPAGKIPAFGTEYSRTTYNKLWEEVQKHPEWKLTEEAWQEFYNTHNGQVPFYSDGDGSTTFRVPRLTGFFEGAGSLDEVGTIKEAGLPNITGQVTWTSWENGGHWSAKHTGALYATNAYTSAHTDSSGSDGGLYHDIAFDAAKSNSIYGTSDTVQPPSIVGMWVITAFVAVTGISSTTLDNIASGLTEAETRIGVLEENSKDSNNFAIISVNNGENVTINTDYIEENPFKGYYVNCIVELYIDTLGIWAQSGNYSDNGIERGMSWTQYVNGSEDTIRIHGGFTNLSTAIHSPLDLPEVTSAPCRVLVQKLGKIGE